MKLYLNISILFSGQLKSGVYNTDIRRREEKKRRKEKKMTSSNYDTMIQTGNPNEYPEYTGELFSELSCERQEEYAEYFGMTLVEAQKDYDSCQRQEERMHEAELDARAEFENMAEYTRFND